MGFESGRVSYCKFSAVGDSPSAVDATILASLAEGAFKEQEFGAPEELEVGWITGKHLYDTQFDYDKNGYGSMLLFAMRVDTNRVPGDVKQAYRQMQEQMALSGKDGGFLSKADKKEAHEEADRLLKEEMGNGKFRRSKAVPILWDLQSQELYCGALNNTATELICKRFRDCFNISLEPLTSGIAAGNFMSAKGKTRDYEDLQATAFTAAPSGATVDHEDASGPQDLSIPYCPWVANSYSLKDFLGNEFLIWLWWITEAHEGLVKIETPRGEEEIALVIDKALEMECAWGVTGKQTLRGDKPSRLPEAADALAHGKWPRKASMIIADVAGDTQWEISLQSDRLCVSGASLPDYPDAETPRERIEERLMATKQLSDVLDGLYQRFISDRVGDSWLVKSQKIQQWIKDRAK